MFPAAAHGAGVSENSIDVAKIPADGTRTDELEISHIQDVSGAVVPSSGEDFSVEMEGAQPGELKDSRQKRMGTRLMN